MTYFTKTKTGRLTAPAFKKVDIDEGFRGLNLRGQVAAKVGDYVFTSGRGISAGTVGRITSLNETKYQSKPDTPHTVQVSATYERLDGTTDNTWLWYFTVIDYAAVQEVKDFYINDGRADRIKVTW